MPPAPDHPSTDHGFTLLELMVALAVFSLAVMALLNLAGENVRAAGAIETRALAAVVAENRAVEALSDPAAPALGVAEGVEDAGDRRWRWVRRVSRTADPDILRVDVLVRAADGAATVAEVSVFRVRR